MNDNTINLHTEPTSVLIVEDLEDTLAWLGDVVSETFPAANLRLARTLKDALPLLKTNNFGLIMVDLGLPDGSGLELIRQIRERSLDTYIVVATIYDDDENLVNALRQGANGYLFKDDHRDRLIEHLKGISNGRAPISDRALNRIIGQINKPSEDLIPLTSREEEVLQLVAKGYNVSESAEMLGLSSNTVKSYLKAVYGKLRISSRSEATAEAIKRRLIEV
ncbi:MAG: response regulator transcription factor [Pseudomonadales bacterium]|nr:response regulator transcription factor [Pseudomonadales bacterium]MBO7004272.1 response regulator transcription factor [Pseudomonadales bacterium]